MVIKKIDTNDAELLLEFYHHLLDEHLVTIRIRPKPTLEEEVLYIDNINKNGIILGVFHDQKIIGAVTLKKKNHQENRHIFVLGIAIDSKYRGQGIGYNLIQKAIEVSLKKAIRKLELEVLSLNSKAIRLYKKVGFEIEDIRKNELYVDKNYYDMVLMGLILGNC